MPSAFPIDCFQEYGERLNPIPPSPNSLAFRAHHTIRGFRDDGTSIDRKF